MKVHIVMISAPPSPVQQMHMEDEPLEVWFEESDADERVTELMEAREDKKYGRYYWSVEAVLRVKDEAKE